MFVCVFTLNEIPPRNPQGEMLFQNRFGEEGMWSVRIKNQPMILNAIYEQTQHLSVR